MLFVATGTNKTDPLVQRLMVLQNTQSSSMSTFTSNQRELTQYFGNVDIRQVPRTVLKATKQTNMVC